jgi:hypothetical protein
MGDSALELVQHLNDAIFYDVIQIPMQKRVGVQRILNSG